MARSPDAGLVVLAAILVGIVGAVGCILTAELIELGLAIERHARETQAALREIVSDLRQPPGPTA